MNGPNPDEQLTDEITTGDQMPEARGRFEPKALQGLVMLFRYSCRRGMLCVAAH